MVRALSESQNKIQKVLITHPKIHRGGKLVKVGLMKSFLAGLNKTGTKPEAYVITPCKNEEEKSKIEKEVEEWKKLVKSLKSRYVMTRSENSHRIAKSKHPRDLFLPLESEKAIIPSSTDNRISSAYKKELKALLKQGGFNVMEERGDFQIEGGYFYPTESYLFYSGSNNKKFVDKFDQKSIFVKDLLGNFAHRIIEAVYGPSQPEIGLPGHVDLILSVFEKESKMEIFYSNFKEITKPFLPDPSILTIKEEEFRDWKIKKAYEKFDSARQELFCNIDDLVKKKM